MHAPRNKMLQAPEDAKQPGEGEVVTFPFKMRKSIANSVELMRKYEAEGFELEYEGLSQAVEDIILQT